MLYSYYEVLDKKSWIIDSGALDHLASSGEFSNELKHLRKEVTVGMPDGTVRIGREIGTVVLSTEFVL